MNFLKNKTVKYSLIAIAALFAIWYFMTVSKRTKARNNWINWINSLPDNQEWKAVLIRQAAERGITLEENIQVTANALYPSNPFKSASA